MTDKTQPTARVQECAEHVLFEAWMRSRYLEVCGTWDGENYIGSRELPFTIDPNLTLTRQLWAAWRDRAALQAAPPASAAMAVPDERDVEIAGLTASVGHLSALVDGQQAILLRAKAAMMKLHNSASPLDESRGDFDARIPEAAFRQFVDEHAALLCTIAQSPIAAAPAQAVAMPDDLIRAAKQALACMDGLQQHLGRAVCHVEADELRAALAAAPAQEHATQLASPVLRHYISHVQCVADLVNNLLLLDQTLPIYGAQYIEHPPGKRRAIAVPPTVSREQVKDSRWIGEGDTLNAAVIWTRAEQPAAQAQEDARDASRFLSETDYDDLSRFDGMASDGEGYDISKDRMKRLAELGVVRWLGRDRYGVTAFGQYVLKAWGELPLETYAETNARCDAEFKARIERLNAEAIAARAAQGGAA